MFTYGDDPGLEPGFVYHGGNTVRLAGDAVQVWVKIGYEQTNGYRWADHAEVRYLVTTSAAVRSSRPGVTVRSARSPAARTEPEELTSTNAMAFSHAEDDPSENGNAMWWVASIEDPLLAEADAVLEYQVVAWNSAANGGNGVERAAEWQARRMAGSQKD